MSFTDPLSVTISGTTTPLPRTSVGENKSEYKSSDGQIVLSASHSYGKQRARRMLRIDTSKLGPDVFRDDQNVERSMSFYMVVDAPDDGYTAAEQLAVVTGLIALATASSNLMFTKLIGGES